MLKTLLVAVFASFTAAVAAAETIGVSMAQFDDKFLSLIRQGMTEYAASRDDVELRIEDAQNNVTTQLLQIRDFIGSGVDAVIVNPVDTDAALAMTTTAAAADVPLVYVNREPVNVDQLPDNQAFVASDEHESGTLQMQEVCRLLRERTETGPARIVLMMGEQTTQPARVRTRDVYEVLATEPCRFIEIADAQTANWRRSEGRDLMRAWLSAGLTFDAVVANNDEMAIGAIEALKEAGVDTHDLIIAGVDATQDALTAMESGDLDVTVFQDAVGQGHRAVDAALALARGEKVDQKVYVPFRLVTPENMSDFAALN